ncbi:hypothetical protein [Tautonia rosea]|uniref:hypothetical protein n=1 Tax=Tautonia rosea TaxID=2728037 RepID=UPI0014751718|nr:hypothetical protein [Tautonia rosea]
MSSPRDGSGIDGFRPVPLPEAARLAGIAPAELAFLAVNLEGLGDYSLTVFLGADGPLFDPSECKGLGVILAEVLKGGGA